MEKFLSDLWTMVVLSSPFLLLGSVLSGVVYTFFPLDRIKTWLGSNRYRDIFYASAIGVPLPLCSCSVIPAAVTLKKAGASRAAVSSFLISTPESGIDSIILTYALMDFPMSVFRPLAAFISATVAGLLNHWFNQEIKFEKATKSASEKHDCCSKEVKKEDHVHEHQVHQQKSKIIKILHYGFIELMDDLATWLVLGFIVGALVTSLIPDNFFATLSPTTSRLMIILVGIPMYICASASTPIAASLVMKGISPGTALIFLLAGPATNVANIVVLQKHLGTKGTIINLISIAGCALGLSYVVDYYYQYAGMPQFNLQNTHEHTSWYDQLAAVFFILLIVSSLYRQYAAKFKKSNSCCS